MTRYKSSSLPRGNHGDRIQCPECPRTFKTIGSFPHIEGTQLQKRDIKKDLYRVPVQCKICNEPVPPEQFHLHKCFTITSPSMKKEQFGIVDPVRCPDCGNMLKNKNSLKVHKSTYHRKPKDGANPGMKIGHLAKPIIKQDQDSSPSGQSQQQPVINSDPHGVKPPSTTTTSTESIQVKVDPDCLFGYQNVPTLVSVPSLLNSTSHSHISFPNYHSSQTIITSLLDRPPLSIPQLTNNEIRSPVAPELTHQINTLPNP